MLAGKNKPWHLRKAVITFLVSCLPAELRNSVLRKTYSMKQPWFNGLIWLVFFEQVWKTRMYLRAPRGMSKCWATKIFWRKKDKSVSPGGKKIKEGQDNDLQIVGRDSHTGGKQDVFAAERGKQPAMGKWTHPIDKVYGRVKTSAGQQQKECAQLSNASGVSSQRIPDQNWFCLLQEKTNKHKSSKANFKEENFL